MQEKRKAERQLKQALVTYDVLKDGGVVADDSMGRTLDVSSEGLHLEVPSNLDQGDNLRITLSLDGKIVTVLGNVVWVSHGSPFDQAGVRIEVQEPGSNTWLDTLPCND